VRAFRDLSIQKKLMLIIMATSSSALLLASTGFVAHELYTFRDAAARDLSTLAEVIAGNSSAAVAFDVPGSAEDLLGTLGAERHIVAACIYTSDGKVFARYSRASEGAACPAEPARDGHRFERDHLALWRPILLDGERIGGIYLRSDLQEMRVRLNRYAIIVALVVLASTLVAFLVSSRLQHTVSEPILHLARTAKVVSERKDYSVRASGQSRDEVGLLITAFNGMLEQIQGRDVALTASVERTESAQKSLVDRSRQLEEANIELEKEIAEKKRAEERIRILAYHDALTGLPNRLLFQDRLRVALSLARRHQRRPAVLFLDVDRFKLVNDSLGHAFGDLVLKSVAERLLACVRESDTVARLGGDEFTLLLPDSGQGGDVARVARKALDSLRRPFSLEGREVFLTSSMGISMFPDDGSDVETLIKNADTAIPRRWVPETSSGYSWRTLCEGRSLSGSLSSTTNLS